jgi:hypothetical protein
VGETDREGFDLIVTADGGENLRVEPQGRIVARLLEGFLLDRLGQRGNWLRVKRRGWLWRPSLAMANGARPPAEATPASDTGSESEAAGNGPSAPSLLTAPAAVSVHTRPDGDTVAVVRPGGQAQVLGRAGDWVRVRVDGWVYGPAALDTAARVTDTGDVTPAQLRSDPNRYRGALIRWRVQFVALRRAEPARTDFEEGEPFLLARGPSGDAGFVYLAVPDELLSVAEDLRPLQHVTVVGRVRTGRSALLGSPIIDLTDIEVDEATP